jgi:hypothetical protein
MGVQIALDSEIIYRNTVFGLFFDSSGSSLELMSLESDNSLVLRVEL